MRIRYGHWLRKEQEADGGDGAGGAGGGAPSGGVDNKGGGNTDTGGGGTGGGGTGGGDVVFANTLGDGLRDNPSLRDFKDVDALATSYVNLKQFTGNSIRIPGEDAGDDARKEFNDKLAGIDGVMLAPDFSNPEQTETFYQSLGAPADANGYEYVVPEEAKGMELNVDKIAGLKALALKEGLTKKQFANLMANVIQGDFQQTQEAAQSRVAGQQELKQEWGLAYDQNINQALSVAKATGAPQAIQDAMADGNTGPNFIKWMHSLASKFNGEGQNLMDRHEQNVHDSPAEIQEKVSEMMNNTKHPYWDATHPQHDAAVLKMIELQKKLHPGQST